MTRIFERDADERERQRSFQKKIKRELRELGRFFFSPVGLADLVLLALGFGSIPQKLEVFCEQARSASI